MLNIGISILGAITYVNALAIVMRRLIGFGTVDPKYNSVSRMFDVIMSYFELT